MKVIEQLAFPNMEMQKKIFVLPERSILSVKSHMERCQNLLNALHLKKSEVFQILLNPSVHWKRVLINDKDKTRICFSPDEMLHKIQMRLIRYFKNISPRVCWHMFVYDTDILEFSANFFPLTAFDRGCSIVKNAHYHKRNRSSLWLDLKGAFSSIKTKHLSKVLKRSFGFDSDVAWVFSCLLTYRGKLQQGSPASPYLFNLSMFRFVLGLAKNVGAPVNSGNILGDKWCRFKPHEGVVLTMYGDDICISSPDEVFPAEIENKVREYMKGWPQFQLNGRKTERGSRGVMEFPGVVIVNGRIRPRSSYVQNVVQLVQSGTALEKTLQGHRDFLNQFGRGGRLNILCQLLRL